MRVRDLTVGARFSVRGLYLVRGEEQWGVVQGQVIEIGEHGTNGRQRFEVRSPIGETLTAWLDPQQEIEPLELGR